MSRFSAAWLIRIVARAPAGAVTCLVPCGQPSKERRRDCCLRRPPPPPEASSPSRAAPASCAGTLVQARRLAGTARRRWSPLRCQAVDGTQDILVGGAQGMGRGRRNDHGGSSEEAGAHEVRLAVAAVEQR